MPSAMLSDAQKPLYDQWRQEREKRRRQSGTGIRQHVIDLLDLQRMGLEFRLRGLGAQHLGKQELAIDASDRLDVGALAEEAGARELRNVGGLKDLLPRETRRRRVGDVVPAGEQAGLRDL